MKVQLKKLKDNPYRDFSIDPLDEDRINELRASINQDGFWGGAALAARGNDIYIAAGRTRIEAAIREGITEAELFVGKEIDDAKMIRMYARENATQRGNNSVSQVGSIASAIRYLAKTALEGDCNEFAECVANEKGVSQAISDFFSGVPGINNASVQQAINLLKSSGNYARIISEVKEEFEEQNAQSLKLLAKVEAEEKECADVLKQTKSTTDDKAKVKDRAKGIKMQVGQLKSVSEKRKITDKMTKVVSSNSNKRVFDFEGVSKHVKIANLVDAFRKVVTGKGIAEVLPVDKQAKLADKLVSTAASEGVELTGTYIKEHIVDLYLQSSESAKRIEKTEQERIKRESKITCANEYMRSFSGGCRRMITYGHKLGKLQKDNPDMKFQTTREFRNVVTLAKQIVDELYNELVRLGCIHPTDGKKL